MCDYDCQILQESRIKIEEEVKEEQHDCMGVEEEETALGLPNGQPQIYGCESPTEEKGDSDEEELKPPVAVWVKEEPKEYVEDEGPLVLDDEGGEGNGSFSEEEGAPEEQWVAPLPPDGTNGRHGDSSAGPSSAACGEPPTPKTVSKRHSEPNVCSVCGKKFPEKRYLLRHMRSHTGEKPYQCSICEKRFSQIWNLSVHKRLHTGERPHECSECGKKFSQKPHLVSHMVTHTGGRATHECVLCEKKYSEKRSLQRHMWSHTGEKRFGCSLCGKRFSRNTLLSDHMRIHTGEKPFGCSVCAKRFHRKHHLALHIRSHTKHTIP